MPHSISEKNIVCQSMLSCLGITDLTTGAVRLGEIQLQWNPWSPVWGEEIEDADVIFGGRESQFDRKHLF